MNCTYIIKDTIDITQAMIDVCQQTSLNTLRNSTDGRSVLKWQGTDPPMFDGDTKYDHEEILVEMEKVEWNPAI